MVPDGELACRLLNAAKLNSNIKNVDELSAILKIIMEGCNAYDQDIVYDSIRNVYDNIFTDNFIKNVRCGIEQMIMRFGQNAYGSMIIPCMKTGTSNTYLVIGNRVLIPSSDGTIFKNSVEIYMSRVELNGNAIREQSILCSNDEIDMLQNFIKIFQCAQRWITENDVSSYHVLNTAIDVKIDMVNERLVCLLPSDTDTVKDETE